MADEKLYGPREIKNLYPRDPNWAKAVDALWRVYYGLYTEKYKKYEEKDELGELIDPWLKNKISKDISYGLGIGQDHDINGNRSFAFGQGGVTKSFMEIVLGAYNIIPEGQNAEEWIPTDLLLTLGNGPDKDHRSNVFEILKNGFLKFMNGIKIGEWNPQDPDYPTPNGTLQWTPEKGLEIWDVDHWKPLGGTTIIDDRDNITNIIQNTFYFETTTQQFITYINNEWVTLDQEPETIYPESENETAAGKHTHKFEPGKLVTQTDHGFTFGNTIKRDGAGAWIKSKADTRANAGTVGIVSEVIDADHFRYITGGLLPGDFVDGADYWLSTTTAGDIFIQSDPEEWEIGNVREFIGTGTANGLEVEIDLGDEITEFDLGGGGGGENSHPPVTIAADSTDLASIDENQVLHIKKQNINNVLVVDEENVLYTWFISQNEHSIAPEGCRVPSRADFEELFDNIDTASDPHNIWPLAGKKLKEVGFKHWVSHIIDEGNAIYYESGTDEYGFKALGSGYKDEGGSWGLRCQTYFLTSDSANDPYNPTDVIAASIDNGNSSTIVISYNKQASSLRLILNNPENWTEGDTVTDYDENIYQTVKIGNQVWLASNFKCTHYADGTAIQGPDFTAEEWASSDGVGLYSYYTETLKEHIAYTQHSDLQGLTWVDESGHTGLPNSLAMFNENGDAENLELASLPEFSSNSEAISNGLSYGNLYRTSLGQLMVVFIE